MNRFVALMATGAATVGVLVVPSTAQTQPSDDAKNQESLQQSIQTGNGRFSNQESPHGSDQLGEPLGKGHPYTLTNPNNEILVKPKHGFNHVEVQSAKKAIGAQLSDCSLQELGVRTWQLGPNSNTSVQQAVEQLNNNPAIEYAEQNHTIIMPERPGMAPHINKEPPI